MTRRVHRNPETGLYHIGSVSYELLVGSRAQVWHRTAHKTAGGLKRDDLMMNKHGRIVSKKKHTTAKKEKRLEKAGYKPKKGTFKLFRKHKGGARTRRRRRR